MKNKKPKIVPLLLLTLLSAVEKSVGSKMFQSAFCKIGKEKKDILNKGDLSCAFYVAGILAMFDLIDKVHATVSGTVKAMEKAGWQTTKKLAPGVVIVWGPEQGSGFTHDHLGFYIGENKAVSNIWQKKVPGVHSLNFAPPNSKAFRPIVAMYKHSDLK